MESNAHDFKFAYNRSEFSDRVLRIEVMGEPPDGEVGIQRDTHHKRQSDTDVTDQGDDADLIFRVNSIYVNSAILAKTSPFFFTLFTNGMKESHQRETTLRINKSEEAAFMELLGFMYSGNLLTTSPTLLVDVLVIADKFDVVSCVRHCIKSLGSLPMNMESALLYLDLPSCVSIAPEVQSLKDAAKVFICDQFGDITKLQDESMILPLAVIEVVLSSDRLQVASEDAVYDLVLKWAHARYPVPEKRREILRCHLLDHVRFPCMSLEKLREVLNDLDHELVSNLVNEALWFKADAPRRQRALAAESTHKRFTERDYTHRPLKILEFDRPHPQCIVYLDLRREECATKLFPAGQIDSQSFHFGGRRFVLSASCYSNGITGNYFGLHLRMQPDGSASSPVITCKSCPRKKPFRDFLEVFEKTNTFWGGNTEVSRSLLHLEWNSFIADERNYFIDDTLHMRVALAIRQAPPAYL